MVTKMWLACTHCDASEMFSDPHDTKSVNSQAVLASGLVGMGCTGLDTLCGVMGLPPSLSAPSFLEHNKELARLSSKEAAASCLSAFANLHQLRGVNSDEIIDVPVTCDGTCFKRGFIAAYGVVAVLINPVDFDMNQFFFFITSFFQSYVYFFVCCCFFLNYDCFFVFFNYLNFLTGIFFSS